MASFELLTLDLDKCPVEKCPTTDWRGKYTVH